MVTVTPNLVFHLIDFIVGLMLFIWACTAFNGSFQGIFLPLYIIFFAVCIWVMMFWIPPALYSMLPFYFSFLGRGLIFLFLGVVIFSGLIAFGIIVIIIAFLYITIWILVRFSVFACTLPAPMVSGKQQQEEVATTTTTTTTTVTTEEIDVNNGTTEMATTEPR